MTTLIMTIFFALTVFLFTPVALIGLGLLAFVEFNQFWSRVSFEEHIKKENEDFEVRMKAIRENKN